MENRRSVFKIIMLVFLTAFLTFIGTSVYIYNYALKDSEENKKYVILPSSNENGIGTELLKYIENYFKSIDCEFVQIDVFAYNEHAKKFYYKNGYEDRMVTVFKKL